MIPVDRNRKEAAGKDLGQEEREKPPIRVEDRRHWARAEAGGEAEESVSTEPTILGEYRRRAEDAERKLREYIEAFRESQREQEAFRERLARDVDRRVDLQFGALVADFLESLDDLDLALAHATGIDAAEPLARGVALARERFLAALGRQGVSRMELLGQPFDPHAAEALRVDDVDDESLDGRITAVLRPGYQLGDRTLRAARVAVGRARRPAAAEGSGPD